MSLTIRNVLLSFAAIQTVQLGIEASIKDVIGDGLRVALVVETESAPVTMQPVEIYAIEAEALLPDDGAFQYLGTASRPEGQVVAPDGATTSYTAAQVYFFRRLD